MKIKLTPQPNELNERKTVPAPGTEYCTGVIDGWHRRWQVFVPSCYDGSKPVPLVISLHGGAHPIFASAVDTTVWTHIAERDGFIVLFPNSLYENKNVHGIAWNVWGDHDEDGSLPNDVLYIDTLIDMMIEKYNIDTTRIYMQGQSNGDQMTSTYIFVHGDRIAAAATLSGPAGGERFVNADGTLYREPQFSLPVIRRSGSEDCHPPLGKAPRSIYIKPEPPKGQRVVTEEQRELKWRVHQEFNILMWKHANKTEDLPRLNLAGNYGWATYDQKDGNEYVFYCIEKGEHGPRPEMAEQIWSYFLSRFSKVDGKTVVGPARKTVENDVNAIAVANGAKMAYVDNRLTNLSAAAFETNGIWYAPAADISRLFTGASTEQEENGLACTVKINGKEVRFAAGTRCMVADDEIMTCEKIEYKDGMLYLPLGDLASLAGMKLSTAWDAAYINERGGAVSYNFASIIKEILGTKEKGTFLTSRNLEIEKQPKEGRPDDDILYDEIFADYKKEYGLE